MLILGDGAPRPADPAARGSSADVPWDGAAVTIGAYDGVHLGHRAVIGRLADAARERGLASVVVTFEPHPARVLRPDSAPRLLCDTATKLELLAETGVDATYVMAFDADRVLEEPEHFIKVAGGRTAQPNGDGGRRFSIWASSGRGRPCWRMPVLTWDSRLRVCRW
ncbi:MAG: hypothetical protein IPI82_15670 [Candidatus Microthrix sp.]|nr:hypothetical protein [Candidatus Microthrix sp.]MBK7323830.1 hypothetical protein [Candidatus Microthrix sp.]